MLLFSGNDEKLMEYIKVSMNASLRRLVWGNEAFFGNRIDTKLSRHSYFKREICSSYANSLQNVGVQCSH